MSFVISHQGQFKPYKLPDLSHYDRVHHLYKALKTPEIKDDEDYYEFEKELKNSYDKTDQADGQKSSVKNENEKVKAYQEQEKSYHLDIRPRHAKDIMSSPPHTIQTKNTWNDAFNTMKKYTYRHLPVLDEKDNLVGMLSDRDLLRHNRNKTETISNIMSDKILTALESARVQDVVRIMLHEKISALPILKDDYTLTGIVTQTDILKFVATGQISL